jgi:hypothetical protein
MQKEKINISSKLKITFKVSRLPSKYKIVVWLQICTFNQSMTVSYFVNEI